MRSGPEGGQQQTAHHIHSIRCECGRSYIGKTVRVLAVRLLNIDTISNWVF
jgi:hypothetical protein